MDCSLCPWDSPGKNTGVGCHFLIQCVKVKSESEVSQSCPTLCDPMDCSLQGSSAHGILQAGILEWVVIPFSRGSSLPRDQTSVSCIADRFFTVWATREALRVLKDIFIIYIPLYWASQEASGKEFTCQCSRHRRCRFDSWIQKNPGVGNGNSLQYSCLENSMNRGDWQATVCGITEESAWASGWACTHTQCVYINARLSIHPTPSPSYVQKSIP